MKTHILIAAVAAAVTLSAPAFAQLSLGGHASAGVGLNAGGVVRGATGTTLNAGGSAGAGASSDTSADIQGRAYGGIADTSNADVRAGADVRTAAATDTTIRTESSVSHKRHKHHLRAAARAHADTHAGASLDAGANLNTGTGVVNTGARAGLKASSTMRLND